MCRTNAKSCEPEGPQDLTHRPSHFGKRVSSETSGTGDSRRPRERQARVLGGKPSGATPHHGTPMLHVQVRVHDWSCHLELETTCPSALREPHLEHSTRMPSSRESGRIEGHRGRSRMWLRIPLPSLSKPHGMPRQGEHNPSYEGLEGPRPASWCHRRMKLAVVVSARPTSSSSAPMVRGDVKPDRRGKMRLDRLHPSLGRKSGRKVRV